MKSIKIEQIGGRDYYVVHKNHLLPLLNSGVSIARIGGAAIPNTYNVYFQQNPTYLLEILKNYNGAIVPTQKTVSKLLQSNTAQDIPWICSKIHSIKKVLITDIEFGELITHIRSVYKDPHIDVLVSDDKFSETLSARLGVKPITYKNIIKDNYDAIFIGKNTSELMDFGKFSEQYYNALSPTGEVIIIVSAETFKIAYEGEEEFRAIFNEFGYTSSIKNSGTILEEDIIIHIRKESPNYNEVFIDGSIYPNIYVKLFIDYILSDQALLVKLLQCISSEERKDVLHRIILAARVKNFMYLPNVEDHIDFINNTLEV